MPGVRSIAFFDVDETLITTKSMFDFYDYYLRVAHVVADPSTDARSLLGANIPREQANRRYYRSFADAEVAEVSAIGRRWFAERLCAGGFFHEDVKAALAAHRRDGTLTVLVSGSFSACLEPIATYCGADLFLGSEPEIRAGRYTGEVLRTMIGPAKRAAAQDLLAAHGIDAADCHGYGDHTSDLGLLELVGHPVVVGIDPELTAIAEARGWARLAGTVAAYT
ncbi:HAD family hydrolase [Nocardia terpenica]|uniref:HAD-IB family hydrolase n=1 Tax=Nocardia terpenica TaxID=455432 RepID=A0A6G9YWV0_9NOCA|nr:HAD-IB family hydrolase [Nocardia terpenica]QIS17672.1 HAD-IB family hydrolase [Nocardia terpenica]